MVAVRGSVAQPERTLAWSLGLGWAWGTPQRPVPALARDVEHRWSSALWRESARAWLQPLQTPVWPRWTVSPARHGRRQGQSRRPGQEDTALPPVVSPGSGNDPESCAQFCIGAQRVSTRVVEGSVRAAERIRRGTGPADAPRSQRDRSAPRKLGQPECEFCGMWSCRVNTRGTKSHHPCVDGQREGPR